MRRRCSVLLLVGWFGIAAVAFVFAHWTVQAPRKALELLHGPLPEPVRVRGLPFAEAINRIALRYGLDPSLVAAVVLAESDFNPHATSPKDARGLMQVRPGTWPEVAPAWCPLPACAYDPLPNLEAGCRYLRRMLDRFRDLPRALAAYHAGPSTVLRYGGVPPYPETERYLRRVALGWWHLRQGAGTLSPISRSLVRAPEAWETAFRVYLIGFLLATALLFWKLF